MNTFAGLALTAAAALAGCAPAAVPAEPPAQPDGVQAALAFVTVRNELDVPLTVAFHPARRERASVAIGTVEPGGSRRLAPVPAGEPIVLSARAPDGRTRTLAARTFAFDEEWTWIVRAEELTP